MKGERYFWDLNKFMTVSGAAQEKHYLLLMMFGRKRDKKRRESKVRDHRQANQ